MSIKDQKIGRDFLKKARKKRNLTQEEVSKAININRSTYSLIENGRMDPSLRNAIKLSNFFGFDIRKFT